MIAAVSSAALHVVGLVLAAMALKRIGRAPRGGVGARSASLWIVEAQGARSVNNQSRGEAD